ncbi:TfoX/Sxy family protein [Sinanaerobacter chloroacetimidivorans]|uniref:TfoX/Sxy family protein n=1 Tax=Sinanaerobacter chloroacetimidivorans TaxID=2818044 RepID=A0A8J8B0X7_9FIRM|nr:TfoX/Sxy family protein [Sinanaerobacter chloroacetimidivorans]MBR0597086.1 TfoX/Sxy family protein [Sinanaerobacter chloroacetimidivorans]
MGKLQSLPNIGKVAEGLLQEAGIDTPEKLIQIGSKEAFLKIRQLDPTACIHMLYGLEGAVRGIRDTELSKETKVELKGFFKEVTY